MRILIWQEQHKGAHGGAESWITDTAGALKTQGHKVSWFYGPDIDTVQAEADAVIVGTVHNWIGLDKVEKLKKPGIWFLHDYWPFCTDRMLMRAHNQSDKPCEANDEVCRNSCGTRREVPDILGKLYTVTGNEYAAGIMRRNGVRIDGVVEEGIDTDLFKPQEKTDDTIYASAAWEAPWKGMHILYKAVEGLGVEVKCLTGLERDELAAVLGKARIFVFPSIYSEIWGLALTEAMACACACIASNVAGARAQIHEGTGVLVPPGNAGALCHQISILLGNRKLVESLGTAARAHVAADHSLEATGGRWEGVLQCVV